MFERICPTDIDAFTEYHNRFFVIMEVKRGDAPLSYGQATALVRIVDALQDAGKDAVLYVCRHDIADCSRPVYLKDTIVTDAYWKRSWHKTKPKRALDVWNYTMHWAKLREGGWK